MALGDFTVVGTSYLGSSTRIIGTCEAANGTEIDFNCVSVLNCVLTNADDQEGAQVVLNSNDGTADTEAGSVYVVSAAADTDTWNYVLDCII